MEYDFDESTYLIMYYTTVNELKTSELYSKTVYINHIKHWRHDFTVLHFMSCHSHVLPGTSSIREENTAFHAVFN